MFINGIPKTLQLQPGKVTLLDTISCHQISKYQTKTRNMLLCEGPSIRSGGLGMGLKALMAGDSEWSKKWAVNI